MAMSEGPMWQGTAGGLGQQSSGTESSSQSHKQAWRLIIPQLTLQMRPQHGQNYSLMRDQEVEHPAKLCSDFLTCRNFKINVLF